MVRAKVESRHLKRVENAQGTGRISNCFFHVTTRTISNGIESPILRTNIDNFQANPSIDDTVYTLFYIRTIFIRTLRLRCAPKFKKMYGLKKEHPQAQPNFTRSYKKECIWLH